MRRFLRLCCPKLPHRLANRRYVRAAASFFKLVVNVVSTVTVSVDASVVSVDSVVSVAASKYRPCFFLFFALTLVYFWP
jgi:hypothetical protein